ncbi:MAG TPA: hypothetical protein PK808_04330 [Polymorphobacter sp.]|nr:hypothetical protein [Polymorphobacter sp.]
MATKAEVTPRDLPTKIVRSADGTIVRMKVVQSDSATLGEDLLAAFQSNVRRIRAAQRKRARAAANPA